MPLKSYLDQLRTQAKRLDGEPEKLVRQAFLAAGVPSSTYYRARDGAELRLETARRVSGILQGWKSGGRRQHGHRRTPAPAVKAAER